MGQKVNPIGFRVNNGNRQTWASSWFSDSKELYAKNVVEDLKIQEYFFKNSSKYSLGKIKIDRPQNKGPKITISSSKVNGVVGKKGEGIEEINNDLKKLLNSDKINIDVREIRKPNLDASIVARGIADKLEKRQSFKRVVKLATANVLKYGAVGVKVMVSGRLNGAEIARTQTFKHGSVPLHTLRSDIDYACHEAQTIYGIIGVKVWICIKR